MGRVSWRVCDMCPEPFWAGRKRARIVNTCLSAVQLLAYLGGEVGTTSVPLQPGCLPLQAGGPSSRIFAVPEFWGCCSRRQSTPDERGGGTFGQVQRLPCEEKPPTGAGRAMRDRVQCLFSRRVSQRFGECCRGLMRVSRSCLLICV